jgi:hypothetical protein
VSEYYVLRKMLVPQKEKRTIAWWWFPYCEPLIWLRTVGRTGYLTVSNGRPIITFNSSYLAGIRRRQNIQPIQKFQQIWWRWCWTLKKKVAGLCASHCQHFTEHGLFWGRGEGREKDKYQSQRFFYLRIFWGCLVKEMKVKKIGVRLEEKV